MVRIECKECGFKTEPQQDGSLSTTVNFARVGECETCKAREKKTAERLGQQAAQAVNDKFLEFLQWGM